MGITVSGLMFGHNDISYGFQSGRPNSAGGVDVKGTVTNNSTKTIKYIIRSCVTDGVPLIISVYTLLIVLKILDFESEQSAIIIPMRTPITTAKRDVFTVVDIPSRISSYLDLDIKF